MKTVEYSNNSQYHTVDFSKKWCYTKGKENKKSVYKIPLKTPIIVSLTHVTFQKNGVILKVKKIRKVFTNYKCKSDQISSGNSLL